MTSKQWQFVIVAAVYAVALATSISLGEWFSFVFGGFAGVALVLATLQVT